jgi:hypothetical protein
VGGLVVFPDRAPDPHAVEAVSIDLGVLDHVDAIELDPPESSPRPSSWLAVLLVIAFCAGGLTAAAQPAAQPRLMFAAEGVIDAVRLVDGALFTHSDASDGSAVTAYDLQTGDVRWQQRLTRRPALLPAGPMLLLAPTSCRSVETFVTDGLDGATGEVRWTRRGTPVWMVANSSIVVFKRPTGGCTEATIGFDPSPSTDFTWVGIDVVTGVERWTIAVSSTATLTAGTDGNGRARWLAVRDGPTLRTHNLVTGALAATMTIPSDPAWPGTMRIVGTGDHLMLVRRERSTLTVTAFAALSLNELWESAIPARRGASRLELDSSTARWCGVMLCLGTSAETVGIDPSTGAERWRLPGRPMRAADRYVLFIRQISGPPEFSVYAAHTGVETIALPGTEIVGRPPGGALLTAVGANGGRLWRLDLGDGTLKEITTLRRRYADCDMAGRYLGCRTPEGSLDVWRLPLACAETACGAVPAVPTTGRHRGQASR